MEKRHSILSIVYVVLLMLSISCNDMKKEQEAETVLETDTTTIVGEALIDKNDPSIWIYDFESDIPVRNRRVQKGVFTPNQWIDFLNSQNEKVHLEFLKHSSDTLFVSIPESNFLTQQMGSTGADGYLSVATFTLTESENVNYVQFDFEEGDHAFPGTYSRQFYVDRNKERFQ